MISTSILAAVALNAAAAPLAAPQGQARRDCAIRIETAFQNWIIQNYDPFGLAQPAGIFQVTFTNTSDESCTVVPGFDLRGQTPQLRRGGDILNYTLSPQGGSTSFVRSGAITTATNSGAFTLGPNASQTVNYQLLINQSEIDQVGDGMFSQSVDLIAQIGPNNIAGSRRIDVGINIVPAATLGLAGVYTMVNGQAVVNLGELEQGKVQDQLRLVVQSTGRYELTFTSPNLGRLRMGDSGWYVPYSISFGGQPVPLTSGTHVMRSPSGKGLTRTSLPMSLIIGDVSGRQAGIYRDVITVAIAPAS